MSCLNLRRFGGARDLEPYGLNMETKTPPTSTKKPTKEGNETVYSKFVMLRALPIMILPI
jgi:hypothetical protein